MILFVSGPSEATRIFPQASHGGLLYILRGMIASGFLLYFEQMLDKLILDMLCSVTDVVVCQRRIPLHI